MGCGTGTCVIADGDESDLSGRFHEESYGNAMCDVACSSGTSARLFLGERDGRGLAQRVCREVRLLQCREEGPSSAAVGRLVE